MQGLPSFIVLDFLEFINSNIVSENDFDLFDLLFDEKYYQTLNQMAEKYCDIHNSRNMNNDVTAKNYIKSKLRCMLTSFCESEEFDINFKHFYHKFKFKNRIEDWEHFLLHLKYPFFEFYVKNLDDIFYNQEINKNILIDNVRWYLQSKEQNEDNFLLSFLVKSYPIEIDFLEWLGKNIDDRSSFPKIDLMPIDVFEKLAYKFAKETGRDESSVKKKLIRLFKDSDGVSFRSRLRNILLPYARKNENKNLYNIAERYLYKQGLYKCIILPLENDQQCKELITKRWVDLNRMSGDLLDIYYCYADYSISGYRIMEELNYLPQNQNINSELPCILLWKDDMTEARIISLSKNLRQLNDEEIFFVIKYIVKFIGENLELDEIVRKTNEKIEEKKATIVNNTIQNSGNMGSAAIGDDVEIEVTFTANDIGQLSRDVQEAQGSS